MKTKFLTLLIIIMSLNCFSQAIHNRGAKFPRAIERTTIDKIPLMRYNSNKLNYWISLPNFQTAIGLNDYLPLSGGTLTGTLNGTNLNISSIGTFGAVQSSDLRPQSGSQIVIRNDNGGVSSYFDSSYFAIRSTNGVGNEVRLNRPTFTGDYDLTFPQASGTLALTSDLSSFIPDTGGNANNLVIDPLGTTTGIAGSVSTIKNISTSTGTNVTQFLDVNRNNTSNTTAETYGSVHRVVNNSTFDNEGVVGSNLVGRHAGSGNSNYTYGLISTAEYTGSGNVNFLVPSVQRAKITGTGLGTIDYARGISPLVEINNPNATVNFAQALHPSLQFDNGSVGQASVLFLDIDGGAATVTGDLAYIRAGNDVLPTVNGNAYFIKSESTLPSEFAGNISMANQFKLQGVVPTITFDDNVEGEIGILKFDPFADHFEFDKDIYSLSNITGLGNVQGEAFKVQSMNTAPASSTSPGNEGEIRYTADFIYVCVALNTWKRSALTTW